MIPEVPGRLAAPRGMAAAVLLPRLSRYGGAEGFAWRMAEALARTGYRTWFVCARAEVDPPAGVTPVVLGRTPLPRSAKVLSFALGARKALARLEAQGPLVSLSCGKTLASDLIRASGGPLEVFWQRSARAWAPGAPRAWKMLRRRLSPGNRIMLAIERRQIAAFLAGQTRLVAVSHAVRDWFAQRYPALDGRELEVIYNAPDLTRFRPPSPQERTAARSRWELAPDQPALLLAGTNFALKGLEPTIRALAELQGTAAKPKPPVLLVAGGRNPGRFARLARELGLAERVRFLGRVEAMSELYHAADAFVLPSFYDTCSNAVLEARASGLPVVSSADNGSSFFLPPEWVVDDPADHHALAAALAHALASPPPGPFAWPEEVACGLEPWLELVGTTARAKYGMGA